MKTILVVILYAVLVGALNLGGAVWNSLRAGQPASPVAVSGPDNEGHH